MNMNEPKVHRKTTEENKSSEKNSLRDTLFTTNSMWTVQILNSGLCGDKMINKRVSSSHNCWFGTESYRKGEMHAKQVQAMLPAMW